MNRNIIYLVEGVDSKPGPGRDEHRKRATKSKPSKPLTKKVMVKIHKANPVMSKSVARRLHTQMSYPNQISFQ
jgi:hypothetical protein